jgi:DNA polymerase (family 10)
MTNSDIADVFSLISKLMDLHGEDSFKSKSYSNAAFQIDRMETPLSELQTFQIAGFRGIGESLAHKIEELQTTGTLTQLQELLKKTPEGIQELMKIKGIGPKKLRVIWQELGIESPGELLYACHENRLIHYKGFGEKSQQSIREALEFYFSNQQRYLYAQVEGLAFALEKQFKELFSYTEVCLTGSVRRQSDIIDELTFVIAEENEDEVLNALASISDLVEEKSEPGILRFMYHGHIPLEVHCCAAEQFYENVFFTTNTASFNDTFMETFPDVAFEGNESEEAIFNQADIPFIQPFLRENDFAISIAQENQLPDIITVNDIKGIIHNHSTWSDGAESIENMAKACIAKGYEYLVISDHSVTSFYANGLSVDRIKMQHDEIDRLNEQLKPFKIFKSIECDILGEGQLDYDEKVLASFDLVIASVHQNLKMTQEKAMHRLLRAVENPYTRILGHPSGRLLLSRKEYPVDYVQLIAHCATHNVVIEINANPRRLDLDWTWIQEAKAKNVLLSINPDAHNLEGIDDVRYGVLAAQKGMLTKTQNLSSYSLVEFEHFLSQKKA